MSKFREEDSTVLTPQNRSLKQPGDPTDALTISSPCQVIQGHPMINGEYYPTMGQIILHMGVS